MNPLKTVVEIASPIAAMQATAHRRDAPAAFR
jgi:hypothetical protein